jgi:hypothetical protein
MRSLGFRESDGPNTQESRKNHNLTLVRGLEHFGVDPRALADLCKKSLGANTTIGEWVTKSGEKDQLGRLTLVHFCVAASSLLCSGTFGVRAGAPKIEVAISGLWDKSVVPLLVGECNVRKEFIEVFAKKSLAEKATKKKRGGMVRK